MSKNLVIVESPTKAKVIKQYLWKDFKVLSSNGHIRDLPAKKAELSPAQMKLPYANIGIDLDNDFKAIYVSSPAKKKVISKLVEELEKWTTIYLATDEDREWEAIAWHLLEILDKKREHESKRVVFHEITKSAILEAFENTREMNDDLVDAQHARRFLDRIVWYKLSPLLWKKIRFWLSAWRVQSVCVRLIVDREREILAFIPEEYWTIIALLETKAKKDFESKLTKKSWEKYVPVSEKESNQVLKDIKWKEFKVTNIERKEVKRNPAPPFITSTLQQEASRKLGFNAKRTMKVAQKLYEWIEIEKNTMTGLITYMRTDSVTLSDKALKDAKKELMSLYWKEYTLSEPRIFKTKSKSAQEAHEAIRPTEVSRKPEDLKWVLDSDAYKLYELIWKRTLATQAPQAIFDSVKVKIGVEDYEFQSNGQVLKFPWFIRIYVEGSDNTEEALEWSDIILPKMEVWDVLNEKDIISTQHFTKWPSRYTEASLIKKMEEEGIWRPSTYAPTIWTIQSRGYVMLDWKQLVPTDTAFVVADLLIEHFKDIVDINFTSWMEDELDEIAHWKVKWKPWLKKFYTWFKSLIERKDKEIKKEDVTNLWESGETCEICWKDMIIKLSKYWKFLSCSWYPDCKNARPIETEEERVARLEYEKQFKDEKCPTCEWEMSVKAGRYWKFLACKSYPDCKWIKNIIISTEVKCPMCGKWELIERKSGKWKTFWSCDKYPECDFATWDLPVASAKKWEKGYYTEKKWEQVFIEFDLKKYKELKKRYAKKDDKKDKDK